MNNGNIKVEETIMIFHMKFGEPCINEKLDLLSYITGFYMKNLIFCHLLLVFTWM